MGSLPSAGSGSSDFPRFLASPYWVLLLPRRFALTAAVREPIHVFFSVGRKEDHINLRDHDQELPCGKLEIDPLDAAPQTSNMGCGYEWILC